MSNYNDYIKKYSRLSININQAKCSNRNVNLGLSATESVELFVGIIYLKS